jgi:hypothetical protein
MLSQPIERAFGPREHGAQLRIGQTCTDVFLERSVNGLVEGH